MKIGAIILARFDSRRLPGKALRDLAGKPLIRHAVDTCQRIAGLDMVALATTDRPEDQPLADYAASIDLPCHRGSCNDVAGRFLSAMEAFGLDAALRFNGDSPLNRTDLLAEAVARFRLGGADLVSNVPGRSYPFGISAEVVGLEAMRKACRQMTADAPEREHVTKFFYDTPGFISLSIMTSPAPFLTGVQLAVDDQADLDRAAFIMKKLGPAVETADLQTLVDLARLWDGRMNGEIKQ